MSKHRTVLQKIKEEYTRESEGNTLHVCLKWGGKFSLWSESVLSGNLTWEDMDTSSLRAGKHPLETSSKTWKQEEPDFFNGLRVQWVWFRVNNEKREVHKFKLRHRQDPHHAGLWRFGYNLGFVGPAEEFMVFMRLHQFFFLKIKLIKQYNAFPC